MVQNSQPTFAFIRVNHKTTCHVASAFDLVKVIRMDFSFTKKNHVGAIGREELPQLSNYRRVPQPTTVSAYELHYSS